MINRIWEETMGKSQAQDDARIGTIDDIPFEFEDPDNPAAMEMEIGFTPLDLSAFPGYSDELPKVFWHAFKGDHDNVLHNVEWFMTMHSEYVLKKKKMFTCNHLSFT